MTNRLLHLAPTALLSVALMGGVAVTQLSAAPDQVDLDWTHEVEVLVPAHRDANIPTWTKADDRKFPACFATDTPMLTPQVVVVDQHGVTKKIDTNAAFDATDTKTWADDVWVIGFCPAR